MLAEAASEFGFVDFKLTQVARRLEVTLQTLYNHVQDREELLHLAAEVLEERYDFETDRTLDWADFWRVSAHALKRLYNRTPGLAIILMSRPIVNAPPLTQHWERAQEVAERSGFSPVVGLWANMALHEFVYSWAAREDQRARQASPEEPDRTGTPEWAAQSPRFAAAVALAVKQPYDDRFEQALEALIAGFRAIRDAEAPSPGA